LLQLALLTIGASVSVIVTSFHAWLKVKPPSVLELLGHNPIPVPSFTMRTKSLIAFPSLEMLQSILCLASMQTSLVGRNVLHALCC
jgi:hypothetical protein